MKELFKTNVGSHMWMMETPDSDIDIFEAKMADPRDILIGKKYDVSQTRKEMVEDVEIDIASHEIGKVVQMILKNNVNFIWGVTSPIVVEDEYEILDELRGLTESNISKLIFYPVRGLALHNQKDYLLPYFDKDLGITKPPRDPSPKRCGIIVRTLMYGVKVLMGSPASRSYPLYRSGITYGPEDVPAWLERLARAFEASPLPERPTYHKQLNDWLYELRLEDIL